MRGYNFIYIDESECNDHKYMDTQKLQNNVFFAAHESICFEPSKYIRSKCVLLGGGIVR